MSERTVPYCSRDLTASFLTETLREAGVIASARVTGFDVEPLNGRESFLGRLDRLRLRYDAEEHSAPASLIAKFSTDKAGLRMMLNMVQIYEREVRFYREIARSFETWTPDCHFAEVEPSTGHSILLLQDLADALVGDHLEGCTPDDARLAIRRLASFHAAWWEHRRLDTLSWLPSYDARADFMQAMYQQIWSSFREKYQDLLPEAFLELASRFQEHVADSCRRLARSPRTIVHGDYRLDNLLFDGSGPERKIVAIDWQMVACGQGPIDVAYFLVYCFEPSVRRRIELALLREYHEVLLEDGVSGYTFEDCRAAYRQAILQILFRVVTSGALLDLTSERGRALARSVARRCTEAAIDHDVAELMPRSEAAER
ncbi:MAG: phosphotransferase [Planctomycetota bacterium]